MGAVEVKAIYRVKSIKLLNTRDPAGYDLLNKLLSWPHIPKDWQYRAGKLDQGPILEFTIKNDSTTLTLQELRIESFYPADESTQRWFGER